MYYRARYYDPELGRFIQADSIVPSPGDPQALNRYAYARNNPVRYTDPSGHGFIDFLKQAIGLVVGALVGIATFGAGIPLAAAIGVGSFTAVTTNALISGVPVGQAFALGAVAGLAGGVGAHFALGAGAAKGAAIGAAVGGAAGAASAAITGSDLGRGFSAGAVAGGILGGVGGYLGGSDLGKGAQFAIGVAGATAAGASGAALTNRRISDGALFGATGFVVTRLVYTALARRQQENQGDPLVVAMGKRPKRDEAMYSFAPEGGFNVLSGGSGAGAGTATFAQMEALKIYMKAVERNQKAMESIFGDGRRNGIETRQYPINRANGVHQRQQRNLQNRRLIETMR